MLDVDSVLASIMYLQLKMRKNIGRFSTFMLLGFKITTNPPLCSGMQNQDQVQFWSRYTNPFIKASSPKQISSQLLNLSHLVLTLLITLPQEICMCQSKNKLKSLFFQLHVLKLLTPHPLQPHHPHLAHTSLPLLIIHCSVVPHYLLDVNNHS